MGSAPPSPEQDDSPERKEALWGEMAHLPVRREAHRAPLLKKMVKRLLFRKLSQSQLSCASPPRAVPGWCPSVASGLAEGNHDVTSRKGLASTGGALGRRSASPTVTGPGDCLFKTWNTELWLASGECLLSLDQGPSRDRHPGLPCALTGPRDSACKRGQTGQAGVWSWPVDAHEGAWLDQMVIQQTATSSSKPIPSRIDHQQRQMGQVVRWGQHSPGL